MVPAMNENKTPPPAAPTNPIVVIPSRLASMRLPDKPLADIHGVPMIVHVWRRAMEADAGPVIVACADFQIIDAVKDAGGDAIYTNPNHASGSDRVFEALHTVDPLKKHDCVINLQGDLPTIDPEAVKASLLPLANGDVDIATLVSPITDEAELDDPNVVKAVLSMDEGARTARALYFSRAPIPCDRDLALAMACDNKDGASLDIDPKPPKAAYRHLGLYAYRVSLLQQFVAWPQTPLEQLESLEQLRVLENGKLIAIAEAACQLPAGVDTQEDLDRLNAMSLADFQNPAK